MRNSNFESDLDPILTDENEVELKYLYELIHKDLEKNILIFERLIDDNNEEYLVSDFTEEMKYDIAELELGESYIISKGLMENPRKPTIDYASILERK
ncbi:hypothetical protein [Staphylococcus caprae]|uniref:hypothetical protein n=1 Tax=Staphylococcus caprae TaxID=29380 RepID=UPI000CD13E90|nr:hypothetical protein [Staphylococcus caprae]POA06087.1 hypothetical protein CD155_03845 [Staphylococcus caprae]SUL89826.1 Uncharacterised protein [Staphylococcus caprae]